MPNYVSPGVYTIEKDISDYTPSINTSVVGIVGFASKGPTNKATLITSQNQLVNTFGPPSENITGQGLEGALEILEQTNSLYFVRAADEATANEASAVLAIGTCPAIIVSGSQNMAGMVNGFGVGRSLTLRIQVYNNLGVAQFTQNGGAGKDFVIPAGTSTFQSEALRKIIGGSLDYDKVGVFAEGDDDPENLSTLALSGYIVGSFAGSGAYIQASACTGTTFDPVNGINALRAVWTPSAGVGNTYGASGVYLSAVTAYGLTFVTTGTNSVGYVVESLYPGTGYNGGATTFGTTSGNSVTLESLGSKNFSLIVNQDGTAAETYKVSFVGSGNFIENIINTGSTDPVSDVIKGNIYVGGADAAVNPLSNFIGSQQTMLGGTGITYISIGQDDVTYTATTNRARLLKLVETTATNLANGTDGMGATTNAAADALIGDAAAEPKTGMQALDDRTLNIGIALVPGVHTQSVQNALITLAEQTQDFLAVLSPPYAVGTTQDAIDWTNGKSSTTSNSRTAAINSSYAAVYWPWVKVFSTFDGIDRWYDPAIFAARQMAYTDAVDDSWFAPAGFRRGRLTKPTDVEVKLNQGDRDSLYSGGNIVNPIVSFPQQGITIFGQRTTQRSPTALDRVNVRRLMIYIRKIILLSTQRFVFEPNDIFTWRQVEGVLNPLLDDIRRRRGITEFRVVCDETTNTPLRVDRNEMWTKVLIKPTKTAEVLIFEINLTNQSAQLGTL
jgi:phage tail sheath protein FI